MKTALEADEEKLWQVVRKHSWDNIPEEKKGEGKFYRKGAPGSWREELTPEQVRMIERITAPLLKKFYQFDSPAGSSRVAELE